jgi:pimeloyl-ACP methyl ester carboxylesterase
MSTTGSMRAGQPSLGVYSIFLRRPPRGREAFVEHMVRVFDAIGSPGRMHDDQEIRELAAISYERDHDPAGPGRQLAAIIAAGDRTAELRDITAPTLVIHGTADRLIAPSGGRATARAIAGSRLMLIPGMGHDLPRPAWPQLIDAIATHAAAADEEPGVDAAREEHPPLQARPTVRGLQG